MRQRKHEANKMDRPYGAHEKLTSWSLLFSAARDLSDQVWSVHNHSR
jgi:hypothetical protein